VGDSEVAQRQLAVIGEQDVRRLDVSVHDPDTMRGLQRTRHFHPEPQHLIHPKRTESADPRLN
jgi:hypothetical protein